MGDRLCISKRNEDYKRANLVGVTQWNYKYSESIYINLIFVSFQDTQLILWLFQHYCSNIANITGVVENFCGPRPIFSQLTFRWGCTFLLVEKKKRKKKKKKRPFCNGFVTHAVRLRAYAISPCLSHLFFFALFRRRTSLQVALRAFPPLPSPSPSPRRVGPRRCLQSFWLERESRNRGRSGREHPDWLPSVVERNSRCVFPSARLIKNNFSCLHRDTSSLAYALYLIRPAWLWRQPFSAHIITRAFALSPYFPFFSPPPLSLI